MQEWIFKIQRFSYRISYSFRVICGIKSFPISFYPSRLRHTLKKSPKNLLIEKFNNECFYCNKQVASSLFTRDHFVPSSLSGTNSQRNIVLSCKPCNLKKGGRLPTLEEVVKFKSYNPNIKFTYLCGTPKDKHKEILIKFEQLFNSAI